MNDPVVLVLPDIHGRDFYKDISTLVLAMCFMKKAYLLRLILDTLKITDFTWHHHAEQM